MMPRPCSSGFGVPGVAIVLQAMLNAVVGLLSVAVSLGQVWAVKHAIDVASHAVQGNIIGLWH